MLQDDRGRETVERIGTTRDHGVPRIGRRQCHRTIGQAAVDSEAHHYRRERLASVQLDRIDGRIGDRQHDIANERRRVFRHHEHREFELRAVVDDACLRWNVLKLAKGTVDRGDAGTGD